MHGFQQNEQTKIRITKWRHVLKFKYLRTVLTEGRTCHTKVHWDSEKCLSKETGTFCQKTK